MLNAPENGKLTRRLAIGGSKQYLLTFRHNFSEVLELAIE